MSWRRIGLAMGVLLLIAAGVWAVMSYERCPDGTYDPETKTCGYATP